MAKNMPGSIPSNTLGVLGDIFSKIAKGAYTHRELELFAKRKNPFGSDSPSRSKSSGKKKGKQNTLTPPSALLHLRDLWPKFWKVVGGRDLTDADLILPAYQPGFDWLAIVPRDLTAQQLYDLTVSTKFFTCWKYWDDLDSLNVEVDYLKPVAFASAIFIGPSVESDTRLSYNQAIIQHLVFLGLRHRIILELFGFWLNREHPSEARQFQIPPHLDLLGWTRTSFLDHDGRVADAFWDASDGVFGVDWSLRGTADPNGGIRLAVS